jgi:thiol-disulfide isomerase/thioredoxin
MRILKIEADVCPQCKALDFILMATPEVKVRKVNIDHELDIDLQERFGSVQEFIDMFDIMGTPTLLFLDENYNELGRLVGAKGITPEIIRDKIASL